MLFRTWVFATLLSLGLVGSAEAQSQFPLDQPAIYFHSVTNATTTLKTGVGVLRAICVNTKGATSTVNVFDNTAGSGTLIATMDTTAGVGCSTFNAAFVTGLTVVTAGGTPADITVLYRQ